jgi:hypothetical protein
MCFLVLLVFWVWQTIADNCESYAISSELILVLWLLVKEFLSLVLFTVIAMNQLPGIRF